MIILGVGSNLGDRIGFLRAALQQLQDTPQITVTKVSPVYLSDALLPDNAPANWNLPYLNAAIACKTSFTPDELLAKLKKIEQMIDRKTERRWGPRVIDIDILAWDDLVINNEKLNIPHAALGERPFALWPLADLDPFWVSPLENPHGLTASERCQSWGSRFSAEAPFHTQQIQQRIDTPQLMGILNLSPDSFSDGMDVVNESSQLDKMKKLVLAGADIIDIGAMATGPNATLITEEEEWRRLNSILPIILQSTFLVPPKISLDTFHAATAEKALALGVDIINDQSGLTNPAMCELMATKTNDVIFMHHLTLPAQPQVVLPTNSNGLSTVHQWANSRIMQLAALGISPQRLIFDVGIGFGKTAEQSLHLLRHVESFHDLPVRLLVGHSRKSFLTSFTPQPSWDRDIETTAISLKLYQKGVDYLRVHDIDSHARAFKMITSL